MKNLKSILKYLFSSYTLIAINLSHSQINFENLATAYGLSVSCGDTFLGNGVAFVDFDNDGWDDLTFTTGQNQSLRFFKNFNGIFSEEFFVTPDLIYNTKAINWVDFDNDGDKDLFVTSFTDGNKLLRNDGNNILVDITASAGLPVSNINTYGASWGDIDNDGNLDLFLSSFDPQKIVPNLLFRSNGDGTFTNISTTAGISNVGHLSFCASFFDYNNDGWQDIYVSNDRSVNTNILYKNNGDNTFTDVSSISGTDLAIDAMSVTIDDFNSDGWLDIYVTNTASVGNYFLKNNGDETFTNISDSSGTRVFGACWGAVFLDAENDTDLDIYVSSESDGSNSSSSSKFFRNIGNESFVTSSTNFYGFENDINISYSNAIGDVDNDGLTDIIVTNGDNQNVDFWKNNTMTNNNWLKVKLEGTLSNRDGIGSFIEISVNGNKQYGYTLCGEGYLAQNSSAESFGIGTESVVDYIKVTWLSGIEDTVYNITPNQVIDIVEGSTLGLNSYDYNTLKVFPNPVSNVLQIDDKSQTVINEISLYDLRGQLKLKTNSSFDSIDLSALQAGIYILKISADHQNSDQYIKIIKK